MSVLEAHEVDLAIGDHQVMENVSVYFTAGELTAVIDPKGAGMSSLLWALAGLQRLTAGRVTLDGIDVRHPAEEVGTALSFVPQSGLFRFAFSLREVAADGRNPYLGRFQREQQADRLSIEEALTLTDTVFLASRPITELSGGERQLVLIARSLATNAEAILLDELTANLDPAHAVDVLKLCRCLSMEGKLVILTTQDLSVAARYVNRGMLLKPGVVLGAGSVDSVLPNWRFNRILEYMRSALTRPAVKRLCCFIELKHDRMNRVEETSSRMPLFGDNVR
jgi:iron complex transport system ATP-binding protein